MITKRLRWNTLNAVTMTALLAFPAHAQDGESWSLNVGVDYSSHHLFRGVSILGGNAVVDRHATLTLGNFNVYYNWFSGDIPATLTSSGRTVPYREDDFGAEYSIAAAHNISVTLGAIAYTFSSKTTNEYGAEATYEFYATAAFDVTLSPIISYYRDMAAVEGGYASIAISHDFPLGRAVSLELSASVGFDFGYNLGSGMTSDPVLKQSNGDLNDLLVAMEIPIQLNHWLSAHAAVQRSIALGVLDKLGVRDETLFVAGVSLTF